MTRRRVIPERSLENAAFAAAGAAVPFLPFGGCFAYIDPPFAALIFGCGGIVAACAIGLFGMARHFGTPAE